MAFCLIPCISKTVSKTVKSVDMFSTNIAFTYKGNASYKTFIGGLYSITILLLIAAYAYILTDTMLSRKRSNVSVSSEVIDLNSDTEVHYPGLNDFYFAFAITDDHGNLYELDPTLYSI